MTRAGRTAIATAAALAASPAAAGEVFAGLYAHDIDDGISYGKFEHGVQIVAGVRTTALDELAVIGKPRLHLLTGVNTAGGVDYLAAGFAWRFGLSRHIYIQPGIGLAIHDNRVALPSPAEPGISAAERAKRLGDFQTKLDLGSRVLFEPELTLGWKATERLSVEASWIHLSHARLAGHYNPGGADVGLRLSYRYGVDRGF